MLYKTTYPSPVGRLTLASDKKQLTGLWLDSDRFFADQLKGQEVSEDRNNPVLNKAAQWLEAYFAGEKPALESLALAPSGTPFQRLVYELMCKIPYGQYTTYGALAKQVAARMHKTRMSSQAVGGAVGSNPISIIIPCHRVIGCHGNLTGYGGGIPKKIWLLRHEGVDVSHFSIPTKGNAL